MKVSHRVFLLLTTLLSLAAAASTVTTDDGEEIPVSDDPKTSFLLAISMIGVSEIGDKTFLIAALMAMRHPRLLVFSASASSLFIMTILSGLLGRTFNSFVPERYVHFAAGILFLIFGYKLTLEGLEMPKDAGVEEELAEVEEEIAIKDINKDMDATESGSHKLQDLKLANGSVFTRGLTQFKDLFSYIFSPTWVQIFIMIFLGELGDRSQISTIAMASSSDYWFVILGATVGHAICSAIAVFGGKFLATKISMRTITLCGAFSFFVFAIMYIYEAFVSPA